MGELCHGEVKIDIHGQQRAVITALADYQRHLPKAGIASNANSYQSRTSQVGLPVDVSLLPICHAFGEAVFPRDFLACVVAGGT